MASSNMTADTIKVYAQHLASALTGYSHQVLSDRRSTATHFVLFIFASLFFVFLRRRFFSPISHIPGPYLASVSRLWHLKQIWSGKQNMKLVEQHDKYGRFSQNRSNRSSNPLQISYKLELGNSLAAG